MVWKLKPTHRGLVNSPTPQGATPEPLPRYFPARALGEPEPGLLSGKKDRVCSEQVSEEQSTLTKSVLGLGHPAGSVGTACDSRSWGHELEPQVGQRLLKKKTVLISKR